MKVENYLKTILKDAMISAGYEEQLPDKIEVAPSRQKEFGDLATNTAMIMASKAKQNPRQIAENIVKNIKLDETRISKVQIAGPGFINFTLSHQHLHDGLSNLIQLGQEFGKSDTGQSKKTQVEFVSANPTGPLTIGHGRQAVLGDTVARLLEATGYDVTREYYFNDAGRQMRVLGNSVRLRYMELIGESVEFPEDHYQGEYIRDIAKQAVDEKGDTLKGSEDVEYFKSLAENAIFSDIKGTLNRLGIIHDVFYNEKSLYEDGEVDAVIQALRDKDLVYDKEGAVWFKTTDLGQEQDRVIVKSTGEPTYRLPDIAYHKNKYERGFDLIIDIFGADHIATYPDVLLAIDALGYDKNKVQVLIHQFVTLTEGKEKIKMSTRKANFVTLDELMDEVGEDVTRYFFLNRSMSSHLNFDLTLAKTQSDENPVYYVQYAHARICSILRFAEQEGIPYDGKGNPELLQSPEELDLIKMLLEYPQQVKAAASEFEPHRISNYLENVATTYHRFQHSGKKEDSMRVVTEDINLTQARLMLCEASKVVLANGLKLLGISRPEKM